ncbi:MAG: iron-containing redox enzyme family protein [Cystobacter sp.]
MLTNQTRTDEAPRYPRLRENLWHLEPEEGRAVLITPESQFEVALPEAERFLRMRSFCNGHHTVEEIARGSGLPEQEVRATLASLEEARVLCEPAPSGGRVRPEVAREALVRACRIWGEELRLSYVGNELAQGGLSRTVLLGWLLEMYHYVHDFPEAIACAAMGARGALQEVLTRYAAQERGHEYFLVRTLENLGLGREEIETSTPLVSTRLVGLLMRDLFAIEPATALLVAALVEAQEFDEPRIQVFQEHISRLYGASPDALEPLFEHQRVDVQMGHARLLEDHLTLFEVDDLETLDRIVNGLHDLKHAFDLQGLEIKDYYGDLGGKYFPRQPMGLRSV